MCQCSTIVASNNYRRRKRFQDRACRKLQERLGRCLQLHLRRARQGVMAEYSADCRAVRSATPELRGGGESGACYLLLYWNVVRQVSEVLFELPDMCILTKSRLKACIMTSLATKVRGTMVMFFCILYWAIRKYM